MAKLSAGLLLYRFGAEGVLEVLLVHPGGPFWARKDDGAWSIPKGEYGEGDDPHAVALREFTEELGVPPPDGTDLPLGSVRQAGGKVVTVWARRGDLDTTRVVSNEFTMEWPRGSGVMRSYPEVDRAEWFDLSAARVKLLASQLPMLDTLEATISPGDG